MSGIAGAIDLTAQRPVPPDVLRRMAAAMHHRGPDDEAIFERPGLGLVSRLLRTAGAGGDCQPAANEDRSVVAVFDGTLFDRQELSADLMKRGHCLAGQSDADLIPHLWEEHGDEMFARLQGQFALVLWDERQRRLVLGRDRFGICPLHWTRQGDWLLFASEIKTLLASGMVPAQADLRGLCQVFTYFGLPGPITCFQGVSSVLPGHYWDVRPAASGGLPQVADRKYWEMDFPDRGREEYGSDDRPLVEEYEAILLRAIERRLRADAPIAAYSSGGLDSSMLVAMARRIRGEPLPTFTFAIEHPTLNESAGADLVAEHVGRKPILVQCRPEDILGTYPRLVHAAESPVIDASAAALFMLAEAVHQHGYRVVMTGEGADEWQAGYPWFRIDKKLGFLNVTGLPLARWGFWGYACWLGSQRYPPAMIRRFERSVGGHNAWLLAYHLMSTCKRRFFSRGLLEAVGDYVPFDDLQLNLDRIRRWHPMSRSLFLGGRVHLAGLHLNARGDRSAMHASVENRYPFLDDELFAFLARLHPRWKMRGLQDKYLQRKVAERWLPDELIYNRKRLLHAPLQAFHEASLPPLIEELLSERELSRTGYFDPQAVAYWRQHFRSLHHGFRRLFVEMGLVGVISTQLWHYQYIDGRV